MLDYSLLMGLSSIDCLSILWDICCVFALLDNVV